MKNKQVTTFHNILIGLIWIMVGYFIFQATPAFYKLLLRYLGFTFLFLGGIGILVMLYSILKKNLDIRKHYSNFAQIIVGIVILSFPRMPISLFGIVCAIYILVIGFAHIFNFILLKRNGVAGFLGEFSMGIAYAIFGVVLLFSPYYYSQFVLNIVGLYCIVYGIGHIIVAVRDLTPTSQKDEMKRHIRISLPIFAQALIPKFVLDDFNKSLQTKEQNAATKVKHTDEDASILPDFEVFVHANAEGSGMVGHVDICFEGTVISYGCYDSTKRKLSGLVGDGVLFTCPREEYIPFVIEYSNKTLFGFGLSLNEQQLARVRANIAKIYENAVAWEPTATDTNAYEVNLNRHVQTKFYKFAKGKFKTYFVFTTNCVLLADSIIGGAGSDIIKLNGIISPGSYYTYLNTEYYGKRKLVVSRTVYSEPDQKEVHRFKMAK